MPIYHNTDEEVDHYCKQLKKCKVLSVAEEIILWKEFHLEETSEKRKKQIQDKMVESCLKLVVDIAKKYRIKQVSFMDVISEGNIGLINALDKFDHTRGVRFSSYAQWRIKQSILKFLSERARSIRFPRREETAIVNIIKLIRQYFDEFGVEPTISYLSNFVKMEEFEIIQAIALSEDISIYSKSSQNADANELIDYLELEERSFDNCFIDETVNSEIRQVVKDVLSEREQRIIALRFGLLGTKALTLKAIGEILGITKERVRQIEKKSIKKLEQDRTRNLL